MNRYRALFIGHKIGKPTAAFQSMIEDEWAETLGLHCDLHVIQDDFDYAEVCDRIQPDFAVFRNPGGYRSQAVRITNAKACAEIPRIGMYVDDPHDTSRVAFLRQLDELGIERFFIPGDASFRQSPELAARVYSMGLFIDGAVFRDYGLEKLIPVSIFGGLAAPKFYAWRAETAQKLHEYFPTLVYTHPGYSNPVPRYHFPVTGADYAKLLNRSWFSLADPTREAYVVRKHLEIPAAGAILVAPDFAELGCYGFRDMQNCVLGSGAKLFEKMAAIANDPSMYETIRAAGQQLVHSRYTRRSWRWIVDWYECQRSLLPGQSVQQQGVLGGFAATPSGADPLAAAPSADSDFARAMKHALHLILSGRDLEEAEATLRNLAGWLGHLHEPYLPLALIELLRGRPQLARDALLEAYAIRERREGATSFDPEEAAWLWITGELLGDAELVRLATGAADGVDHLSLRRARAVCTPRTPEMGPLQITPELLHRRASDRPSIHWTGQFEWSAWLNLISRVMSANQNAAAGSA